MSIKTGADRNQISFLPASIEDYVTPDDPVRAYDAFVDHLKWEDLGIQSPKVMGRPCYDPKVMLKLLLYSYSYGIRSSRKIERACNHNLSFIWLTSHLQPDHKTIAEFRRKNKTALANVLTECVKFCIKIKLIEGNILFVDGTKIRANASIKNTYTKEKSEKTLVKLASRIEELLASCEAIDRRESDYHKLTKSLADKEKLKAKVKEVLKELETENRKGKNIVDSDCSNMRSVQGSHASYNVQSVTDDKHGLLVNIDPVSDSNDLNQFSNQIDQANKIMDKNCKTAVADSGYANTDDLSKLDSENITVIVPSQAQSLHVKKRPFSQDEFIYDKKNDCYRCPVGNKLKYMSYDKKTKQKKYRITRSKLCRQCRHYGICTKAKRGRSLSRLLNKELKEKFEAQYLEPESQKIYSRRKEKAEHPFGHIKRNLKVDAFLLKGLQGVKAEASLLACCFNIRRMITILSLPGLLKVAVSI